MQNWIIFALARLLARWQNIESNRTSASLAPNGFLQIPLLLSVCLLLSFHLQGAEEDLLLPPGKPPIEIESGFNLLNLISINEKEQFFKIDGLFSFSWDDPRLAYASDTNLSTNYYLDNAVDDYIDKIWHLQVEFLNGIKINYTNKALVIFPNGRVEYLIRFIGEFEYDSDLRQFPFDKQKLNIKVASFLKDTSIFHFVLPPENVKTQLSGAKPFQEERIEEIHGSVTTEPGISLANLGQKAEHSILQITISIKRNPNFFIIQVIVPLLLIFTIGLAVFFTTKKDQFLDKIQLLVTCFLVLVATKFILNEDLPHVGYLMLIDKLFFVSYITFVLMIASVTWYKIYEYEDEIEKEKSVYSLKVKSYSRLIIPILFVLFFILIFIS